MVDRLIQLAVERSPLGFILEDGEAAGAGSDAGATLIEFLDHGDRVALALLQE